MKDESSVNIESKLELSTHIASFMAIRISYNV